jgi:hypothetical protein
MVSLVKAHLSETHRTQNCSASAENGENVRPFQPKLSWGPGPPLAQPTGRSESRPCHGSPVGSTRLSHPEVWSINTQTRELNIKSGDIESRKSVSSKRKSAKLYLQLTPLPA